MRNLLIFIVVLGGIASVALCGSYGWDQATVLKDQVTASFIYGMVAVFSLALHVVAIRLWMQGKRKAGVAIGLAAFLAFVMTAFTSLGGLVSRADRVTATRQDAIDSKADWKQQIDDLTKERNGLRFKRTSQETVDAAKRAANAAKDAREAECGKGDPKQRGKICRTKEDDEAKALKELTAAQENRAATARFDEIESDLKRLREARHDGGGAAAVGSVDPLNSLLATLMGAWADVLSAWQKAVFAVVYDICLVAGMAGIELLGGGTGRAASRNKDESDAPETQAPPFAHAAIVRPKADKRSAKVLQLPKQQAGRVSRFIVEHVAPASARSKVEIADVYSGYRAWCMDSNFTALEPDAFGDQLRAALDVAGIEAKAIRDRVYLMGVTLTTQAQAQSA